MYIESPLCESIRFVWLGIASLSIWDRFFPRQGCGTSETPADHLMTRITSGDSRTSVACDCYRMSLKIALEGF